MTNFWLVESKCVRVTHLLSQWSGNRTRKIYEIFTICDRNKIDTVFYMKSNSQNMQFEYFSLAKERGKQCVCFCLKWGGSFACGFIVSPFVLPTEMWKRVFEFLVSPARQQTARNSIDKLRNFVFLQTETFILSTYCCTSNDDKEKTAKRKQWTFSVDSFIIFFASFFSFTSQSNVFLFDDDFSLSKCALTIAYTNFLSFACALVTENIIVSAARAVPPPWFQQRNDGKHFNIEQIWTNLIRILVCSRNNQNHRESNKVKIKEVFFLLLLKIIFYLRWRFDWN